MLKLSADTSLSSLEKTFMYSSSVLGSVGCFACCEMRCNRQSPMVDPLAFRFAIVEGGCMFGSGQRCLLPFGCSVYDMRTGFGVASRPAAGYGLVPPVLVV